jgi:hypothetical protein
MARLLCYSLRVLYSCEEHEKLGTLSDKQLSRHVDETSNRTPSDVDETSNYISSHKPSSKEESDGYDSVDDDFDLQPVVDMYKDARRLYPWQGEQRHLLKRVRDSIQCG